ncbi:hypothetical protein ACWCXE_08170 [Streptomyces sp. NPDC001780]
MTSAHPTHALHPTHAPATLPTGAAPRSTPRAASVGNSRVRAAAVLLALVPFLLTGCRIPATGVVETGAPATGLRPVTWLYFVRDGALYPVGRPAGLTRDGTESRGAGVETAVTLLLRGPASATGADVATELPPDAGPPRTVVKAGAPGESGEIVIGLTGGEKPLGDLAAAQLACTAAAARALETRASNTEPFPVTLTTPQGRRTLTADAALCPAPAEEATLFPEVSSTPVPSPGGGPAVADRPR